MKFSRFSLKSGGFIVAGWLGFFAISAFGGVFTVTTTADSGAGSLRQAILDANANGGTNSIFFQINGTPPFTITPQTALPIIANTLIDGTTQHGFSNSPAIELNGAATGANTIGLRLSVGSSTVRGLAINRFAAEGILLDAGSSNNVVQGNFIGTDVTGVIARGNGSYGIFAQGAGNVIGGTSTGQGNVISGNGDAGIYILNASNNVAQGNLIGLAASGATALKNGGDGIVVFGANANVIGGAGAGNFISGNAASGIYLTAGAAGNFIAGNRIGTDISGSNPAGNLAGDGITLNGAPGNIISNNLISANGLAGISISAGGSSNVVTANFIGTDVNGKIALGNHLAGVTIVGAAGTQIGGTNFGAGNLIAGNVQDGILLTTNSAATVIQGNLIGLGISGTNALANGDNGITINVSSSNVIGGPVSAARNFISGNGFNGIGILSLNDSGNIIAGNYLGTDVTGRRAVSNTLAGVRVQGCSNWIGGILTGNGNVISGNGQQGIWLIGTGGNVSGNFAQGNIIGLDATGSKNLANGNAGVGITGAAANQIGGAISGARNVISGNGNEGIFLIGPGANFNVLQGNYIGADSSGTLARGNALDGIYMQQARSNLIGGIGAGNLISGNSWYGMWLTDASWNTIQGNFIGTKADGSNALANIFHGIDLEASATNNVIGGVTAGAGNRIAFAQTAPYAGVRVRDGAVNDLISGNSIFGNAGLGIDLSANGVNINYDCESGIPVNAANRGQNFPVLTDAYSGTSTRIRGTMDGKTGKTYALEFFASPLGDVSGYGEGQVFLGQTNLTLGATCSANFTFYLPATAPSGWVVTATATDATNNTSEFSAWIPVTTIPSPNLAAPLGNLPLSISWANNGGSFALQQTFSLSPPQWITISNVPALPGGIFSANLLMTASNAFYRVIAQ